MEFAPGTHVIDVHYLGRPGGIAACALETPAGLAIVDPGPASSLAGLERGLDRAGLALADLRALLLTHIHLDHAGAAGPLVRDHPAITVYVQANGARHLVDPSRLLGSARRIYGEALPRLFGEIVPIDAGRVRVLPPAGTVDLGGRTVRVTDAPGHASHHVAYLDETTGTAFTGDTAGERFAPDDFVLPVTPPPDIDVDRWRETLATIRAWRPETVFVTHFGPFHDASAHLDRHAAVLLDWAERVRASLADGRTDDQRAADFAAAVETELRFAVRPESLDRYLAGGLRESWTGLARYWRGRTGEGAGAP